MIGDEEPFDVLVVGAGPAGLGVGVALKHAGITNFQILDRGRPAQSFLDWPSGMQLITPSFPSNSIGMLDLNAIAIGTSPGYSLGTEHPLGKDFAAHLMGLAQFFELPTRSNTEVVDFYKDAEELFVVMTIEGELRCRHLIWATGEFQFPNIPTWSGASHGVHNSRIGDWAEYGAKKTCAPVGSAVSLYSFRLAGGYRLALRGFGVFIGLNRIGGLFMHRYQVEPRWMPTVTVQRYRCRERTYVDTPGILRKSDMQWPSLSALWRDISSTLRQFFWQAMPIFVLICVVASLMAKFGVLEAMSRILGPLMAFFNLPSESALAVVLSSIRKDGIFLFAANDGLAFPMAASQVLRAVYLAGVLLPCLVTALTIARESTWKSTGLMLARQAAFALLFSFVLAWGGRWIL